MLFQRKDFYILALKQNIIFPLFFRYQLNTEYTCDGHFFFFFPSFSAFFLLSMKISKIDFFTFENESMSI